MPFILYICRGRYTQAIYDQMGLMDFTARDFNDYVQIVLRLIKNDTYQNSASLDTAKTFRENLHKNDLVARQWNLYFSRLQEMR